MAARLLCLIGFIAVLSQFFKVLLEMGGLPNLVPPTRDFLLLVLAVIGTMRTNIFKARGFYIAVLLYFLVIVIDIGIGAFTSRHFEGLYFARLYFLPLVSAVAARGLIMEASAQEIRGLVRLCYWCGVAIIAAAFGVYVLVEFNPKLLYALMGGVEGQALATAWYIAGGTWVRMGLPATSPNALGLILAFYMLLLMACLADGRHLQLGKISKFLVLALATLAMAMTFSRSSWLALFLGLAVTFFLYRTEWKIISASNVMKMLGGLSVLSVVVVCGLIYADYYSNGLISEWLSLNKSGTDPSMVGHGDSFVDAIESLDEYFWFGYPKGTVSARALLFGMTMNNVENSIFGVFFVMGVPLGLVFLALVVYLMHGMWVHKIQWGVLATFILPAMLLPYIFEPDMVGLFITLSVLLGRAMQCSEQARAEGLPKLQPATVAPSPWRAKKPPYQTAFQPTIFDAR
jgi:hypothetical protein